MFKNSSLNILFIFLIILPNLLIGQNYFRLKADFSIKQKSAEGIMAFTKGTVYYDQTYQKIVYDIKFPEKEIWLFYDTLMLKIKNDSILFSQLMPIKPNSTIFAAALNNSLSNFGLEKSQFTLNDVEKDEDLVISTWSPNQYLNDFAGNIKLARKHNELIGIVFYNNQNEIVNKQLFKGYLRSSGIAFPAEITDIIYKLAGKELKVTTFKNLVVNEMTNNEIYNLTVPVN